MFDASIWTCSISPLSSYIPGLSPGPAILIAEKQPQGGSGPPRGPGLGHFSEVIDFDDVGRETLARWDLESEVEETQTQGFPSSASERLVKG